MTMRLAPYENFKGFATHKPPLIVFMICLGLFAVVLMTLAYYVKVTEIQNLDLGDDWNVFLENFSDLEFCIVENGTVDGPTTSPPVTTKGMRTTTTTEATSTSIYEGSRNYSVSMLLSVVPTRDFLHIPHNLTHLAGAIFGEDIGLKGYAAEELINVTMELPFEWNQTHCTAQSCDKVNIYACVHLQASSVVFPATRSPQACESVNDTGVPVEYHARIRAQSNNVDRFQTYYCHSRPVITLHYKLNPKLTVWLSLRDRSVINLHLMHTSYFLFVMVITLLCYAIIKGHPHKNKLSQAERIHGYTTGDI